MKTLNQRQMDQISGAGSAAGNSIDYRDYDNFSDYLVFMHDNHLDPLSVNVPGLRSVYKNWCKDNRINAHYSAVKNGWAY